MRSVIGTYDERDIVQESGCESEEDTKQMMPQESEQGDFQQELTSTSIFTYQEITPSFIQYNDTYIP